MRRSSVHGKGVFALRPIAAGKRIIEYKGARISAREADRRHPHDPANPNHTFYFLLEDGTVIDGGDHGNTARWINHACEPNCEPREISGHIYIYALRPIAAGEELTYDYSLTLDEPFTPEISADYACACGSPHCRGTMLALPENSK